MYRSKLLWIILVFIFSFVACLVNLISFWAYIDANILIALLSLSMILTIIVSICLVVCKSKVPSKSPWDAPELDTYTVTSVQPSAPTVVVSKPSLPNSTSYNNTGRIYFLIISKINKKALNYILGLI